MAAASASFFVNSNTYRTLEFETIRALVLSHVGSASGRAQIEALAPHTSPCRGQGSARAGRRKPCKSSKPSAASPTTISPTWPRT